ncbi:MAG TPA: SDR family oxidoreductase [Streptosporangiaceae bacterium]|nr:SDR family oxidoreductase [Streptosporangiaceae bacterium]
MTPAGAAVVVGGASGIGRATVELLRRQGTDVYLADIDEPGAARVVSAEAPGRGVSGYCDLGSVDSPGQVVQSAVAALGRLDALIVCAGVLVEAELRDISLADWERTMAVNLRGPFLLVQAAAPILARSSHGRVVLTASTAAFRGGAGTAAYAASKGGLVAMTRSLALGLAPARICVNCVAPGWIDTPFNDPYWSRVGNTEDTHAALEARIPLGAQGTPAEVAAAIAFLASPAAGYINGQALAVDGGLLAS